jgi:hypothetical protein
MATSTRKFKEGQKIASNGEQRLRDTHSDYTPYAVVEQFITECEHLVDWLDPGEPYSEEKPCRILDPSAGGGIIARTIGAVYPGHYIHSVEIRPEEEENLKDAPGTYSIESFEEYRHYWLCDDRIPDSYDLIITNPPFGMLAPKDKPLGASWIPQLLGMLNSTGILVLYALNDLGQRSEAGVELFKEYPPYEQYRICGPLAHRADGKTDARDYSWWLWWPAIQNIGGKEKHWQCYNLPRLPAKQRKLGNHPLDRIQVTL